MSEPYGHVQQQPHAPPPQPTYVVYPPSTANGMGTTSFVLAIVAMVFSIVPVVGLIDWILLPLGALFGLIGLFRTGRSKGLAIAGLILNVIGLGVMLVAGVALIAMLGSAGHGAH